MATEVFRFATIRQPSNRAEPEPASPILFSISGDTPLVSELRKLRSPDQREKLLASLKAFVSSNDYAGAGGAVSDALKAFVSKLSQLPAASFNADAKAAFDAAGLDSHLSADRIRVGDSIVAASIDYALPAAHRSRLMQLAGAILIADAVRAGKPVAKGSFEQPAVVLPKQLFPLPKKGAGDGGASTSRAKQIAEQRAERERATKELDGLRAAVDDVVKALRRGHLVAAPAQPKKSGESGRRPPGFALNTGEGGPLSKNTKAVLQRIGLSGQIDASRAIDILEDEMSREASALNRGGAIFRKLGLQGNVASGLLDGGVFTDYSGRHPGACPLPQVEPPAGSGPVTVPTGHGEAKVLGIADLMIVEQKLARYELGEIAHIENVLQGETRVRSNRLTLTTEEFVETETEESEETEKDLTTSERFELQSQAQQVQSETASKQAGLTISASYGPTVETSANASASTNSSRQQSSQIASSYARETTAKAVSRIQKRSRLKRSTRTTREFIERNLHKFEGATDDIVGTYRYVDKIYTAQVVNYGKRLMLEFIVPEPAAFYRHALARQPIASDLVECPQEPGYCHDADGTFHPLEPKDMTPESYLFWAAQYSAEGVEAPPTNTRVVSMAKKGPDPIQPAYQGGPKISSEAGEIDIPDGYNPVKAIVNIYGETEVGDHFVTIQVQDKQFQYSEPWQDLIDLTLHQEATSKIPVSINTLRFHNYEVLFTVFCVLSQRKYEEWQTKTYFAVMNAYRTALSRYQAAVEAARMNAGYAADYGRSPAQNRQIESTELKKSCITMMSGQHFESFDGMSRGSAPYGYPEINFTEAKAESRFIRLFEHGLDWMNLTYVFYPYFWTRKDQWIGLSQISDNDNQFQQFLQAGAARAQVPVRVGFEASILNYFAGVEIWDAEGNLINFDDDGDAPQLSLLQEMKSQLSNEYVEGAGSLDVTTNSASAKGTGTEFSEGDERRQIRIGTAEYVIDAVDEASQQIRFDRPFESTSDSETDYALGPRLVGQPWEVKIPTNLVKLSDFPVS
ncbi:hypothetical protein [Pseudomonas chlororaphis]|uniref:hypothetical protein n=1 Tax=Pseudomonas chlororaphis TaxID=587753 RepID=UPI0007B34BA2|nr:hypothetical protein [Pseudomonas chlororaphis]AZC50312.1 hypothetical protein C4K35_2729 [Pseudomonas chlororaphis subsp. piscium]AZC56888.1 hypothetical protein C4K34_2723 [Pseudomonas chlororaphis subsp. piscium]AZC63115.1 hypothetical protein C4K33_2623 [Pseudomonas chlororaphis subsp. piscium]AZC69346.1 hypothetical protein C4K32_2684 [Pseudomonas chlororaphis subsp. piscium]AZC75523.1 hypothetical protein C4K31_2620 [Pseudomonas chlororaphis subsp. piscium]